MKSTYLLAALLAAGVLTACGKPDAPKPAPAPAPKVEAPKPPETAGSDKSQISSKRCAIGIASAGECSATIARGCSWCSWCQTL